nr:unnamed protein product [Callosobruchus chinensis]
MVTKTDVGLKNFFIFNSTITAKEGEELKKILYYYPITDHADVQIRNVGLVEGIINFTETFKPSSPVNSLHTSNTRQLYFQPEKNFWIVMTLHLTNQSKSKDGLNNIERTLEDDVQDNVYEALFKQSYYVFRLFWNTFKSYKDIDSLKVKLEKFFNPYLKCLNLAHADILDIFNGIQYLPLDKNTFLKVQCFVNHLESSYPEISHTAFLYNDHLIWSGIEPEDMQTIYQYLIGTLLPANVETELQGGSMPRNASSPFMALRHGRFITGPTNLKLAKTIGELPKLYLFGGGKPVEYYFVVYRALSATVCFFIKADTVLTLDFFKQLDELISAKLISLVTEIAEYCSKQIVSPSVLPDSAPKFIYFNKLNLAYKSTVHLDNKHTGNLACSKESMRIMADIQEKTGLLGKSNETILKTMNDYWIVGKCSNSRQFYIALQQKNASLIEISDEIKKLCDSELKGIFFHPV